MMRPEDVWPVDGEYRDLYETMVAKGRRLAAKRTAAVVAIARNAMPTMANTLLLVDELRGGFDDLTMFVYENDSTDGTDQVLDQFAREYPWMTVRHDTLGGIDSRGFEPERTVRLAHCRNQCHAFVAGMAAQPDYVIVLDMDPEYGFSVDGVFNSLVWLDEKKAGAMASYSLWCQSAGDGTAPVAHYDAWAARPVCWWRDRRNEIGMAWFSAFMPPVGSPPMEMNSAFGGLCVYGIEAFLAGGYSGEDCEHVPHHRRMRDAGHTLYLNPGSRYIAHWR